MRIHSQGGHKSDAVNIVLKTNLPVISRAIIGSAALDNIGNLLVQSDAGKNVLLLCQAAVRQRWALPAVAALQASGFAVTLEELPDGESAKSHERLLAVWAKLQELQFDRSDSIVAIGGGALTDLAGFAAATYLR